MNISKFEQRTLHALARGGCICVEKDGKGKIVEAACITREGLHAVRAQLDNR